MAIAYRNKFSGRCELTGVELKAGEGWIVKAVRGNKTSWRLLSAEAVRREGHLTSDNPVPTERGGRGATKGLDVISTWAKVFEENEATAQAGGRPLTDEQISDFMHREFPASSEDSKSPNRVRMYRSNYNRGVHSFSSRGPAKVQSREYGSDGKPVEAKVRGGFGGSGIGEAKVREIVEKSVASLRAELKADDRPIVQVNFDKKAVSKVDAAGKHRKFLEVLKKVEAGLPVLLVGPSGSGKTHLAGQIAEAMKLPFTFNSMSEGVSESSLLGRVLPNKDGEWSYRPAPFVTAFQEGGVHLLDEIDASDPNLLVTVNAAIANGLLSLPFAGVKPIKRHARCIIIAAANTYGSGASREYVGRNQLDAATLNRFTMGTVEVDYDRDVERAIVAGVLGSGAKAQQLLEWCWKTRDSIMSSRLRRIMSTRNIEDAAKLLAVGFDLGDVQKTYFQGWAADEAAKCGGPKAA